MVALIEDGTASGDFTQPIISSPELQKWMTYMNSSHEEMIVLRNGASFGPFYWKNPEENMRLLAEVIGKTKPDIAFKCAILGLIHDLGEIVIGDVIPSDDIRKVDKSCHEQFSQRFLVHASQKSTMELYFMEFEACESVAAQITHEADSLECRIQAVMYILRYPEFNKLLEFLESVPIAVYFQDLTNLLSKEEISLREEKPQSTIIFVTGGPGAGKDTMCTKLAEEHGFCHIPTGDLLRKEIGRTGSRYSKFIQQSIDIGFAVPAKLMISLLTAAAKGRKWLLNGFPRSFDQLFSFEQRVIFEVLEDRLAHRAKSSTRSDDKDIKRRLEAYSPGNKLELRLEESGQFERIDASGTKEAVYILAKEGLERLQKSGL
ncbi:adenylate kinase-domain-containing protein [Bisporella sp. PMI_857]|nr:adenylate kinase-domain-containing protein [Bisporella sp. PMI_857]